MKVRKQILKKWFAVILTLVLIISQCIPVSATECNGAINGNDNSLGVGQSSEVTYSIGYQAYIRSIGWSDSASNGKKAGTTNSKHCVEALRVWVDRTTEYQGGSGKAKTTERVKNAISGKAYIKSSGWKKGSGNPLVVGNLKNKKRIEAISLKLKGELAKEYDIYYTVYAQDYGWLGWSKNGEISGTNGFAKRIEAVKIVLVKKGAKSPGNSKKHYVSENSLGYVTYKARVRDLGWDKSVADGTTAGVSGKQMEALRIWLANPTDTYGKEISGSLQYKAHSQEKGWLGWKTDGKAAGVNGKRLEAVRIKLTGKMAKKYDIYYRVQCETYGYLGWTKNGGVAGTTGCNMSIESIQIKLVAKKSSKKPKQVERAYLSNRFIGNLSGQAFMNGTGWTSKKGYNKTIGTIGESRRMEGLKLSVNSTGKYYDGKIKYSLYMQNKGWTKQAINGQTAGIPESKLRGEAFKIELTGELGRYCDVWYRAYVQDWGWLGWAKNGQVAGSKNASIRLEAIQVRITPKNAKAPGENEDYLKTVKKNFGNMALYGSISNRSSSTPYIIAVDTNQCLVGIYNGSAGNWTQIKEFQCAPGKDSSPTVKGEYTIKSKGLSFGEDKGYSCWYYTEFYGNYLFHSILYSPGSQTQIVESGLGTRASHGCVRLSLENAKWIYDNMPSGTKVYVY